MLGDSYDLGRGVPADFNAAVYWFRLAAEQGNVSAQSSLAWHLFTGLGGERNDREALAWANRAADNGSAAAMAMIGEAYLHGRGVPPDVGVARGWLEKAAAAGSGEAASDLANLYETGNGVPRDDALALGWHRKAAALGCNAGTIALALRAEAAGDVHALDGRSMQWLAVAADPGETGTTLGSRASVPNDATESGLASWAALSSLNEALQGDTLRQYETGMRYLSGDGVMRDTALGDAWLQRAQAGFAAEPHHAMYADAARTVEQRVSEVLSADERERARRVAVNLLATVPSRAVATGAYRS